MVLPALVALALAFGAWEAWIEIKDVKPYLVPAPSAVVARLWDDPVFFAKEGLKTLEAAMLGFVGGTAVALGLATVMSQARALERSIFPLAILVKVTPIVAIARLTGGRSGSPTIGVASRLSISASNAPSASSRLLNGHSSRSLQSARNAVSDASNPRHCWIVDSAWSAFGSAAPSITIALTVSGNIVAHTPPSSLP